MSSLVERLRRLALRLSSQSLHVGGKQCPPMRIGCRPEPLEPRLVLAGDITQLGYFPTWDGSTIKSTDPAGIAYHAPSGHLFIADAEIDQTRYFTGTNIFEATRTGDAVSARYAGGNDEPTGITYSEFDGYFYITNDDERTISRYDASLSAPLAIARTRSIDGDLSDPEGITSDPAGNLYIISGKSGGHGVWVAAFDADLQLRYKFSISDRMNDAEGIAYHPVSRHLFVVSAEQLAIFEYTLDGTFVEEYDISGFSPPPVTPQGLTFAPTFDPRDDPGSLALYIADGGDDEEPDGGIYVAAISGVKTLGPIDFQAISGLDPGVGEVWYSFQTTRSAILTLQADNPNTTLTLFDESLARLATSTELDRYQRIDYPAEAGRTLLVQLAGAGSGVELRIANLVVREGAAVTIHGTPQDDQFVFQASTGQGFTINGIGYRFADAASFSFDGAGGNDLARLYGSPRANTLTAGGAAPEADPQQATLTGDGLSITVTAERIDARGHKAGSTAILYESSADDRFDPFWKWTRMSGPGYFREIRGFRSVVRVSAGDSPASSGDSASGEILSLDASSTADRAALVDAAVEQTVQSPSCAVPFQDLAELLWLNPAARPRTEAEGIGNTTGEASRIDLLFTEEP